MFNGLKLTAEVPEKVNLMNQTFEVCLLVSALLDHQPMFFNDTHPNIPARMGFMEDTIP